MIPRDASAARPQGESLVRAIGTFGLAAGIINITIGAGIFRLPANVAGALGAAAPIAYLVCAVAMGLIVYCIADAGKRVSLTGGPYAYVGTAFGPYAAFLSGVLLWMLGTFATAAVSTVLASSLGLLVPALSGRGMEIAILVAAYAFWSVINLRGVALSVQLNSIATVAKLLPLLLIAVGGAFFVNSDNLRVAELPAAGDVARTSLLLIFAFAGIECALVPSGEVRDTERTIPRAIALAMAGITLLYIALQMVAQGILGDGLAQATVAPLADAAGASLGGWARALLLTGATVSMFGYLGGMTLSMPRMVFALARDGFLPRTFAAVDARHHVPQAAIVAQSSLALVLAISGTFEKLAIFANVSALALYFGCALAAWRLRRPGEHGAGSVVPWLACGVIAWVLTGLTRDEWLGFGGCLAVATIVYLATRTLRGDKPGRVVSAGVMLGVSVLIPARISSQTEAPLQLQARLLGDGAPVVLLGGGLLGADGWGDVPRVLARTRRVLNLQSLAVQYGLENRSLPAGYSIQTEVDALGHTLEALRSGDVDIVGMSHGGVVAIVFALQNPQRVRTLTLIEPPAFWVLPNHGRDLEGAREMQALIRSLQGRTIEEEHVEQFRCLLGDCIGGRSPRRLSQWPQWVKYRNSLRGLYTVGDYDDNPASLRRLRVPSLIVTGAQTVAFHRKINETLLQLLPRSEPLELGAGHNSPTADPEHFAEEWQKFQKRSAASIRIE